MGMLETCDKNLERHGAATDIVSDLAKVFVNLSEVIVF
jgi:hypothetical protein